MALQSDTRPDEYKVAMVQAKLIADSTSNVSLSTQNSLSRISQESVGATAFEPVNLLYLGPNDIDNSLVLIPTVTNNVNDRKTHLPNQGIIEQRKSTPNQDTQERPTPAQLEICLINLDDRLDRFVKHFKENVDWMGTFDEEAPHILVQIRLLIDHIQVSGEFGQLDHVLLMLDTLENVSKEMRGRLDNHLLQCGQVKGTRADHTVPPNVEARMIDHTALPHNVEVYSKGNQVPHDEKVQTNNHLLQYDHIKGKKDDHTVPHDVEARNIIHSVLPCGKVYSNGNEVTHNAKGLTEISDPSKFCSMPGQTFDPGITAESKSEPEDEANGLEHQS